MTSLPERGYSPPMMNGWQHTGAFVLQLRPETDVAAGRFEGRVEHVASGRVAHFHSVEELLAFIGRVLKDSHPPQQSCRPEAGANINPEPTQSERKKDHV